MASDSSTRTSSSILSYLGILVALGAVTVVAIGLLALSGRGGQTLEQRRAATRVDVRMRLDKEAHEKLYSEGWADKAKGLAHIAIADAIPLTVAELRSKKPAPSQVKVEPTLPIMLPDPNATEPPPPAMPSSPQGADTIRFTPLPPPMQSAPAAAPAAAPAPAAPAPAATPATTTPAPAATAPAPTPAAPAPAAPAPAPVAPPPAPTPEAKPAPAPTAPAPTAPATPPAPAPVPVPPPPAPAPAPEAKPAPAPAPVEAIPARPPLINPTENPAPTK